MRDARSKSVGANSTADELAAAMQLCKQHGLLQTNVSVIGSPDIANRAWDGDDIDELLGVGFCQAGTHTRDADLMAHDQGVTCSDAN